MEQPQPAAPANNAAQLKKFQEETVDKIQEQITLLQDAGSLRLPENYAVGNQLKLAWLKLITIENREGKKALEFCTKESICNALLEMCIEGLSVAKKQCDFIMYGNKLTYSREYHGTIALARRVGGVMGVPKGRCIYQDDIFEYSVDPETDDIRIDRHEQKLANIDMNKIIGAYSILHLEDGTKHVEIMTMLQIRQAWMQGATKGQSPAHKNFPDQMAIKTVDGRACKLYITTSDDAGLFRDDEDQSPAQTAIAEGSDAKPARTKKLGMSNAQDVEPIPTAPAPAAKTAPVEKPAPASKEQAFESEAPEPEEAPDWMQNQQ